VTFQEKLRLITNCFPNKKLKRFIERGEVKIDKELDFMQVIRHVKEMQMRFFPKKRANFDIMINVDERPEEVEAG
jgi:hypothetical protein